MKKTHKENKKQKPPAAPLAIADSETKHSTDSIRVQIRVPTQQFGFFELTGSPAHIDEMIEIGNKYAEKKILPNAHKDSIGEYKEFISFTNEKILFNELRHVYKDVYGNELVSGSTYAKSLEKPFDMSAISAAVSRKTDISQQTIIDMWGASGEVARTFGTALHLAMENHYKYRKYGTEKQYHLPKHPFLLQAVQTFPHLEKEVLPELLVSHVANKMVGQIDGLLITGERSGVILDYKSDGDISKNLNKHFNQLSYYAAILTAFGWKIEGLEVWNYTTKWDCYKSHVLPIITK